MRVASLRWSPVSAYRNSRVPDLAMIPIFSMTSCRLMPIPLSAMVIVPAPASKLTRICSGPSSEGSSARESNSNRSLSIASYAFEISSRRKISLLLYSERTIRSSSWTTSASNLRVSCSVCTISVCSVCTLIDCSSLKSIAPPNRRPRRPPRTPFQCSSAVDPPVLLGEREHFHAHLQDLRAGQCRYRLQQDLGELRAEFGLRQHVAHWLLVRRRGLR